VLAQNEIERAVGQRRSISFDPVDRRTVRWGEGSSHGQHVRIYIQSTDPTIFPNPRRNTSRDNASATRYIEDMLSRLGICFLKE
jgi:hypothetical protein